MEAAPLISVIVPVYNVEAELPECIDSIRRQTYRNLEILLVDDGSPDRCGEICDRAAEEDGRVRVIHQVNGGVSAARNAGLDAARGEYTAFVDGDDTIPPGSVEELYRVLRKYGADMASGQVAHWKAGTVIPLPCRIRECVLSPKETAAGLLDRGMFPSTISKLYRAELFQGIRFPVDMRIGEDTETLYRLMEVIRSAAFTEQVCYWYRFRENSTIHGTFQPWHYEQVGRRVELMTEGVERRYPDLADLCALQRTYQNLGMVEAIADSGKSRLYKPYRRELRDKLRKDAPLILKSRRIRRSSRARVFLYRYGGERLYMAVLKVRRALERWRRGI